MRGFLLAFVAAALVFVIADSTQAQERFRSRRVAILDQRGDLVRAQAQLLQQQNIARQQARNLRFRQARVNVVVPQRVFVPQQRLFLGTSALQQQLLLQNQLQQLQAIQGLNGSFCH